MSKLMQKMKENKNKSTKGSNFKANYDKKLWSESMLRVAVRKGELLVGEFESITGKKY